MPNIGGLKTQQYISVAPFSRPPFASESDSELPSDAKYFKLQCHYEGLHLLFTQTQLLRGFEGVRRDRHSSFRRVGLPQFRDADIQAFESHTWQITSLSRVGRDDKTSGLPLEHLIFFIKRILGEPLPIKEKLV